jgi:hypothetical protein
MMFYEAKKIFTNLDKVERHLAGFHVKRAKSGEILRRLDLAVEDVQHFLPPVPELRTLEVGQRWRPSAARHTALHSIHLYFVTVLWIRIILMQIFCFLFGADPTFLPDADPDPHLSFQIKTQTPDKVLK